MNEVYSQPSLENHFHGRLSEGILAMMNLEAALLRHTPPLREEDFKLEETAAFARKVNEMAPVFDGIFTNPGFHPAAAYPNIAPLAKVSLLTAPFIAMKGLEDNHGTEAYRKEFSQYNVAVKDAIRANPAMSRTALALLLEGASMWAKVPRTRYHQSTLELEKTMRGASSEVVTEQLLDAANIPYTASSADEDIRGVDFVVALPGKRKLRIDIKSNPRQINRLATIDQPSYKIFKTGIVTVYTGTRDVIGPDDLRLADEHIDEKSAIFANTLHEIADRQADEVDTLLAELALRFARL